MTKSKWLGVLSALGLIAVLGIIWHKVRRESRKTSEAVDDIFDDPSTWGMS